MAIPAPQCRPHPVSKRLPWANKIVAEAARLPDKEAAYKFLYRQALKSDREGCFALAEAIEHSDLGDGIIYRELIRDIRSAADRLPH